MPFVHKLYGKELTSQGEFGDISAAFGSHTQYFLFNQVPISSDKPWC